MPVIVTAPRAVASVTATESDDWQVVSTPTGFGGINSTFFADNDYVAGFCIFENGEDWEEYDTDDDTTSTLLQISNISGTVTISRPATPYASSNSGDAVNAGSGTHTLVVGLGSGSAKRLFRETNPTWLTLSSGDPTPSVEGYRLIKTNGSTAITAFDDMESGKVFFVKRGNADIVITDNANIDCGGSNLTLTADYPMAVFAEDAGVATLVGGSLRADLASTSNGKGASLVGIEDAGGVLAAATVEAALLELRKNAFIDGSTVAADGNNEITVAPRRRYQLTNADSIAGVIGLSDGEFCQIIAPASGSTTLEDAGTTTSGQALELSGSDKVISSTDEAVYTLVRVGSAIRLSGGSAGSAIEVYSSVSAMRSASVTGNVAGDLALLTDANRGGFFRWDSSDLSTEVGYETTNYWGVYYPPTSDATGASGAWVRIADDPMTVNVKWFGAVEDNATDDKAAFQAAADYVEDFAAAQGKSEATIYVPAGQYYLASTWTVASQGVAIRGAGRRATVLRGASGGTSDILYLNGGTSDNLLGVGVYDMFFTRSGGADATGGAHIHARNCVDWDIHNCDFDGFYNGIKLDRSSRGHFSYLQFTGRNRLSPSNAGILVTSESDQNGNSTGNHLDHCEWLPTTTCTIGNTDGVTAGNTTFTSAGGPAADGFHIGMIGDTITIEGAGSGGSDLVTTITAVSSTTSITLADAATDSGAGHTYYIDAPYTMEAGILVESSDGLYLDFCHWNNCRTALVLSPDGADNKDTCFSINCDSCYFDTAYQYNVLVEGTAALFGEIDFNGGYSRNAGAEGARINPGSACSGIRYKFNSCRGHGRNGVRFMSTNISNVEIGCPLFEGNNELGQNSGNDIEIDCDSVVFSCPIKFNTGNAAGVCIQIDSTATNVILGDFDFDDTSMGDTLEINVTDVGQSGIYLEKGRDVSVYPIKADPTDATPTTVCTVTLANDQAVYFETDAVFISANGSAAGGYKATELWYKDGAAGIAQATTTETPTNGIVVEAETNTGTGVSYDGSSSPDVAIKVTGTAGTTHWRGTVTTRTVTV